MDVHISYGIADKLLTLAAVLFQLAVLALITYGVSYVVVRLFRLERTKRTLGKVFVRNYSRASPRRCGRRRWPCKKALCISRFLRRRSP